MKFPSFVKDKEFIALLKKLLTKGAINRLCKFANIKSDPFFSAFSWENLISLNLEPPYVPKINAEDDSKVTPVPYINHTKTFKEWVPSKSYNIEKKVQAEYDKWFKNF